MKDISMYNPTCTLDQASFLSPLHETDNTTVIPSETRGETTSAFLLRKLTFGTLDLVSWGLFKYLEEQGGVFDGRLKQLALLVGMTHADVKRSMDKLKKIGAVVSKRVGRLYHWCVVGASKPQKSLSAQRSTSSHPVPFVEPEKAAEEALRPSVGQALQSLPGVEPTRQERPSPPEPRQAAQAVRSLKESEGATDKSTKAPKTKLPQEREDSPKKAAHKESKGTSSELGSVEGEQPPRGLKVEGASRVEDLVKEQAQREAWRAFWKERGQSPERIKNVRVAAQWAKVEQTYAPKDLHPGFVEELDTNLDKLDYPIVFLLSKAIKDGKSEDWRLLARAESEAFRPYASHHASHQVFDTKALEVPKEERVQGKLGLLDKLNETLQKQAQHRAKWNAFLAEMYEGCADAPQWKGKEPLEATCLVWGELLPGVRTWMRELEQVDLLDTLSPQLWERLREKDTALGRLEVLGQAFERQGDDLLLKPDYQKAEAS